MSQRQRGQKQLARVAGVDRSTISRWLSGRMLPPLEPLLLIAADLRADAAAVERRWHLAAGAMRDPQSRREAYLAATAPPVRLASHADLMRALRDLLRTGVYPSGSWSAGIRGCAARRSGPCCAGSAAPPWPW